MQKKNTIQLDDHRYLKEYQATGSFNPLALILEFNARIANVTIEVKGSEESGSPVFAKDIYQDLNEFTDEYVRKVKKRAPKGDLSFSVNGIFRDQPVCIIISWEYPHVSLITSDAKLEADRMKAGSAEVAFRNSIEYEDPVYDKYYDAGPFCWFVKERAEFGYYELDENYQWTENSYWDRYFRRGDSDYWELSRETALQMLEERRRGAALDQTRLGLFQECCNPDLFQEPYEVVLPEKVGPRISLSGHDGYYITERGTILMKELGESYVLGEERWLKIVGGKPWGDESTVVSYIPAEMARRLKLNDYKEDAMKYYQLLVGYYFDRYREGCVDLMTESKDLYVLSEPGRRQWRSKEAAEEYFTFMMKEVYENKGVVLVAWDHYKVAGWIAGMMEPQEENETEEAARKGVVKELVSRHSNRELADELGRWFASQKCDTVALTVWPASSKIHDLNNNSIISGLEKHVKNVEVQQMNKKDELDRKLDLMHRAIEEQKKAQAVC